MDEVVCRGEYRGIEYQIKKYTRGEKLNFFDLGLLNEWHCGYVKVCDETKAINYDDEPFCYIDCHGGLTYGDHQILEDDGAWIGFDCMHYGDSILVQDVLFCEKECKHIIDQLISKGIVEEKL